MDSQPKKPETTENEPKVVESHTLFAGQKQVIIRHEGELYRLLLTRNNRLILQK